jgi:hypothetical protein
MTSQLIRQLVPLSAAVIGIGIGYVSASNRSAGVVSSAPPPAAPVVPTTDVLELQYPPTMEGAIQAANENTGSRREWLLDSLTVRMTAAELEATANRVESMARSEQYALLPRLMAAWAKIDPEGSERWLVRNAPSFRKGAKTFINALSAFAKKQPLRAFAIIDSMPPGVRREELAEAAATELAKLNPRQAAEYAAAIQDPAARKLAESGVLKGLAYADPLAALARMKELPDERRTSLVSVALNRLFAQDPSIGFAELSKLPEEEQSQHVSTLAWKYAERAPHIFAEFVEKRGESGNSSNVAYIAGYAANAMAAVDPVKAMDWAQKLPASARNYALNNALGTWSQKEPSAALAWALKNKPSNEQPSSNVIYYDDGYEFGGTPAMSSSANQNVSTVLRSWSGSDPAAMKEWAKTEEGAPYRQEISELLLNSAVGAGKIDEAKNLVNQLPADRQQAAMQRAIGSIMHSNPNQAAEWLTSLPVDARSAGMYQNLVQNWASTDVAAAAAWIEKLPQSPARDSASLAYAQRISAADPSAAMEWALGTAASEQRRGAVATIYYQWQRKQPGAAAEWLQNAQGLTPEEQQQFKAINPTP